MSSYLAYFPSPIYLVVQVSALYPTFLLQTTVLNYWMYLVSLHPGFCISRFLPCWPQQHLLIHSEEHPFFDVPLSWQLPSSRQLLVHSLGTQHHSKDTWRTFSILTTHKQHMLRTSPRLTVTLMSLGQFIGSTDTWLEQFCSDDFGRYLFR